MQSMWVRARSLCLSLNPWGGGLGVVFRVAFIWRWIVSENDRKIRTLFHRVEGASKGAPPCRPHGRASRPCHPSLDLEP